MTDGPPRIFDHHALGVRRERARRIGGDTFLLREAEERLAERLASVQRTFLRALLLGRGSVAASIFAPVAKDWTHLALDESEAIASGAEQFDLIVSVLSLHSTNDLPGVLAQSRRVLKPDGLFVAALFGGETLFELKESLAAAEIQTRGGISPRVAPFADVRDLGGLLQRAGFALPVADVERTIVHYSDFKTIVADLRAMGETNALVERSRMSLSRVTLAATLAHYSAHHAQTDGRLNATFDIVYLMGWAPHESQQRPLKPGSATSRLAEALKTTERSAGEPVPRD